jgi:DNA-binding NtrC family response regulator
LRPDPLDGSSDLDGSAAGDRIGGIAPTDVSLDLDVRSKVPRLLTPVATTATLLGASVAHLLLVDDDNDIVDALGELLRAEGHEVHTASTGEEGLVVLRASPLPDALVLDVDMPVLGGPGMAHKMLLHDAGEEKVPIILMSARQDLPEIAREMGTAYVVKKPTTIDAFLTVLDRALRERRAPLSA